MSYGTDLFKNSRRIVLGISFLLLFGSIVHAQTSDGPPSLNIKDFSVFSALGGDSLGVDLSTNIDILGGAVGTKSNLQMGTHVFVAGDIYSRKLTANTGNSVKGTTYVFGIPSTTGSVNVLQFGAQGIFTSPGKLLINGNSQIDQSVTIEGSVQHPEGTTYSGPVPGGGEIVSTPVFPGMPALPTTTEFSESGSDITSSQPIEPGSYGNVILNGNQTITFSGVGDYYLKSINNSNINTFTFDFKGNTTGTLRLFIAGNAALANIAVNVINGGNAGHIYTEVHGAGPTEGNNTAFSMNINGTKAHWEGTVWVPFGEIVIGQQGSGSSNLINGAIWSGKKVTIGFNTTLNYIPLGSGATPPQIKPYYPPPTTGKVNTLIGSELTQLYYNPSAIGNDSIIYRVFGDKVLIDVISLKGKQANTLAFLKSNGMIDLINNGTGSLIITGKFPIANLLKINSRPDLIDYARPLYWPIRNSGIIQSQGDTAMETHFVRGGYSVSGRNVKVGVISDSYNTLPGDIATVNILNGDLPPAGVQVVGEYTLGQSIDEGRAMLEIVHDVAPDAALAFRTGYLTAGDFAQGIGELKNAGCKVIVDDITYITEPYYVDGVVAKAVDQAVAGGVSYFSAAGNFGKKSYESTFTGMAVPGTVSSMITGQVHDFGSGNPYQTLYFEPGNYTIVLQWKDAIYSLGQTTTGTRTDLDLYLVDNAGAPLFGFNRDNLNTTTNRIGTDPLEVLPFTVTGATTARLLIANASGPDVPFKYIVFRGSVTIGGYNGASTIVGQANAAGSMAVGAVLYSNTQPYGVNPPTIASFSSIGGMQIAGTAQRFKPDITAPNGVNTTVDFNSFDLEGDAFPNFYGTSAAAPHAAAAAALLIEGRQKFLGQSTTPAQIKTLFQTTANHMGVPNPGYSPVTGYGFAQPFAAMQTFANPKPEIVEIQIPSSVVSPVSAPFLLTVKGNYLTPQTQIYFRGIPVATTHFVNSHEVNTTIDQVFSDDPPVKLYNPPITAGRLDGGFSDELTLFSKPKKHIVVTANNATKKYGERLPALSATVKLDGVTVTANTHPSLSDLKLDNLKFKTPATSSSNVALYYIQPLNPIAADDPLLKTYTYEFDNGVLRIEKLPLKITPQTTTLTYGDKIHDIQYDYVPGPSALLQNPDSLKTATNVIYKSAIVDSIYALMNGAGTTSKTLVNSDLDNLGILISNGAGTTSKTLVNGGSGTIQTSHIAEIDTTTMLYYLESPLATPTITNGAGTTSKTLVNTGPLVNGTASILVNGAGTTSKTLVNGDPGLLNSNTTGSATKTNVAVIVSYADVSASSATSYPILTKPANLVTGINAGTHAIVPAAFLSGNFDIKYGVGSLTINKWPLQVIANNAFSNDGVVPTTYTSTVQSFQYQDATRLTYTGPQYTLLTSSGQTITSTVLPAGVYTIQPSSFTLSDYSNYTVPTYVNGKLYVNPYGNNAKKVNIQLKCVEPITDPVYKYVAHFTYTNNNATPVYVPVGPNNKITSTAPYSGTQITVFEPGTHTAADFKFNGQKLTWDLITNDGISKKSVSEAYANSSSPKCQGLSQAIITDAGQAIPEAEGKTMLYPNPVDSKLWIATTGLGLGKTIAVTDAEGRSVNVHIIQRTAQWLALDVSGLHRGVYFIQLQEGGTVRTLSFVKL